MLPSLACVTLFDGAVHLTDEIAQPERNIPLVMVISNTLSGVMAFFAAIVLHVLCGECQQLIKSIRWRTNCAINV